MIVLFLRVAKPRECRNNAPGKADVPGFNIDASSLRKTTYDRQERCAGNSGASSTVV